LEHANPLTSMVFSPDGELLIVGGGELGDFGRAQRGQGEVRVWTVATGRLRKLLPHPAMVTIVRFSPDGRLLLTGCSGGWSAQNVYLWDARTLERCLAPLAHDDGVGAAAFSPDSLRLATSDDSGMIYLWETSTGRPLGRPMRHARGVSCLDFTADGRLLASASADSTARIWDGITGEALSPSLPHPNLVRRLEFSPDGRHLCTACYQGAGKPSAIRLYRLDVNRCPTGELRMLAEILGGFRIDGEGTERPVGPEEQLRLFLAGSSSRAELQGRN
jgi:WD40 repeat protein